MSVIYLESLVQCTQPLQYLLISANKVNGRQHERAMGGMSNDIAGYIFSQTDK